MPTKKPKKAALTAKGKKARAPRRKKLVAASAGLAVAEVAQAPAAADALREQIIADGGAVLAAYARPLGGHPWCSRRCRSSAWSRRRTSAIDRRRTSRSWRTRWSASSRYLDPIIAVRRDGKYWTPNGNHRLGAMHACSA